VLCTKTGPISVLYTYFHSCVIKDEKTWKSGRCLNDNVNNWYQQHTCSSSSCIFILPKQPITPAFVKELAEREHLNNILLSYSFLPLKRYFWNWTHQPSPTWRLLLFMSRRWIGDTKQCIHKGLKNQTSYSIHSPNRCCPKIDRHRKWKGRFMCNTAMSWLIGQDHMPLRCTSSWWLRIWHIPENRSVP
jgi:hypothetical protein